VHCDLLGLTFAEFAAWSRSLVGHAERFHRDLYRRTVQSGRFAPQESPLWQEAESIRPGTIAVLAAAAAADQLPALSGSITADDGELGSTTKVLCRLADGQEVESVLIPMRGANHHTACVSSQVGCKMGCSFCHTAKMGLVRNLTAHEIVAQVVAVRRATGVAPRNVVFMGMGEPLDNPEAVAQAVRVLTDGGGLALRHQHITVSTVGRVDGLLRWAELGLSHINLAVSLTSADPALRSELMPVNRLHSLAELRQALQGLPVRPERRILISCVVIPGVTDDPKHTLQLIAWLADLPVQVNLIPFNPIPSRPWRAPSRDEVMAVRNQLVAAGIPVRLRVTKGEAVMAACGQLGDPARRRQSGGGTPGNSAVD
jgi:23S rRNA (adenine2503-C2)-methyltransferase